MATLKQIRQRIKTAKNIQQITKAMKLVAAARLKKATDRVLEARPYADKLKEFRHARRGDQAVLALTFVLTVLVDITMALMAGMALALLLKARDKARAMRARTPKLS